MTLDSIDERPREQRRRFIYISNSDFAVIETKINRFGSSPLFSFFYSSIHSLSVFIIGWIPTLPFFPLYPSTALY
jgi:hypothetical protein